MNLLNKKKMSKKFIDARKYTINIDKIYKDDFNLMKTIAQTKKMRHNNKTLEVRKNHLKDLMIEINNEYQLTNNPSRKNLQDSNINFHNEYELFNKRTNKKDTKMIFKDLVKLYKSKGYRIPNFSIQNHNLFKINPLLEANTDMISNGLLESQMSKKSDDSEKIIKYLKKLGIILSDKMSNDSDLQKNLMKKFNLPKVKAVINDEDSVENLKKKIELLKELINTNALAQLDENKKRKFRNISRQNSFVTMKCNSNKKYALNKDRKSISRRPSNYNKRVLKNLARKDKQQNFNFFQDRKNSNESSISNASYFSNNYLLKKTSKDKSSHSLNKFNFTSCLNSNQGPAKTPKGLNIPVIDMKKIKKRESCTSIMNIIDKRQSFHVLKNLSSKQNSILKINSKGSSKNNTASGSNTANNNKIFFYNSTTNNNIHFKLNIVNGKTQTNRYPIFIKTQSNNESNNSNFSDEFFLDGKSPRDKFLLSSREKKKEESIHYPYTSRNEFINFAYNKFAKRKISDAEFYIKNYLNKVKGFDNERIEIFVNDIYDKNIKNNIKELEKQIIDNDLYSKTERLYLNSHLIKRIKPLLNVMGEKDKTIYRLEKNLTDAVTNK
jgi:hypothetical protein